MVAGTATTVSNRVSRRQANKWAAQEQQSYGPMQQAYQPGAGLSAGPSSSPPADDMDAKISQLRSSAS